VEISHLKAIGRRNWRRRGGARCCGCIARAREEGADVTCDVYPYTAGSTQLHPRAAAGVRQAGGTGGAGRETALPGCGTAPSAPSGAGGSRPEHGL
jgi:N-acyl-D-aspartate/D-glutamate deacylase